MLPPPYGPGTAEALLRRVRRTGLMQTLVIERCEMQTSSLDGSWMHGCTFKALGLSPHHPSHAGASMIMRGPLVTFALLLSCASAAVELQRHKPHHGPGGMCPDCPHPDRAPDPGNFSFYFLVRQVCRAQNRILHPT